MGAIALPYRAFITQFLDAVTELVRILEVEGWHHADDGSEKRKGYLLAVRSGDILWEKLKYYDHIKSKRPSWVQREGVEPEARPLVDGSTDRRGRGSLGDDGHDGSASQLGAGRETGRNGDADSAGS